MERCYQVACELETLRLRHLANLALDRLFAALRSEPFVRFLELLSGIGGLVPDPGYEGSGVHLTGEGGLLAVHHDRFVVSSPALADFLPSAVFANGTLPTPQTKPDGSQWIALPFA